MSDLFSIIYASASVKFFSKEDLIELLKTFKSKNMAKGITGMLLYKDGNFIQAIEGHEEDVIELYQKIVNDPRHTNVIQLGRQPIFERQFPDWSMGFRNIDDLTRAELEGYSRFLDRNFTPEYFKEDPIRAYTMLQAFKQNM
ncbi:MAG: BLUF domain-containing protein [Chloroflexota bacterium]